MLQLKFVYDGGASKRFHTCDTLRTQDIAAHSFGVAWLCELLTQGNASKNLIMAALAHDLAEHMVGDIPSPSKREMNIGQMFHDHEMTKLRIAGLATYDDELTEGERYVLKMADNLDGCMFCIRERSYGNMNLNLPFERFKAYTSELWEAYKQNEAAQSIGLDLDHVRDIFTFITLEWNRVS